MSVMSEGDDSHSHANEEPSNVSSHDNAEQFGSSHKWEAIAESAFNVHKRMLNNPNAPENFADLSESEQIAWEAVARHVLNLANWWPGLDPMKIKQVEGTWEGWRPDRVAFHRLFGAGAD